MDRILRPQVINPPYLLIQVTLMILMGKFIMGLRKYLPGNCCNQPNCETMKTYQSKLFMLFDAGICCDQRRGGNSTENPTTCSQVYVASGYLSVGKQRQENGNCFDL